MGTVKLTLPDDLEKTVRREIALRKGVRKGAISEAVTEALQLWMRSPPPIDSAKYREQYPGKYILVYPSGEVLGVYDTIDEIFEIVAETEEKVILIHPKRNDRKVRLGWRASTK